MERVENWGDETTQITERITYLFNNDLLSDVGFVVRSSCGEKHAKRTKMAIPAHKFLLSIYSPVFYAMFCGEMAEKSDTIDLPDCEYEGILEMLHVQPRGGVARKQCFSGVVCGQEIYPALSCPKMCRVFDEEFRSCKRTLCSVSRAKV